MPSRTTSRTANPTKISAPWQFVNGNFSFFLLVRLIQKCRHLTRIVLSINRKRILRLHSCFEVERGESEPVLVLSIDVRDGGRGLLQLRLAEFDDRTQAKVIPA